MTTPSTELYRELQLTQGQVAIVDVGDYAWLSQWKWFAKWSKCTRSFYAFRNDKSGEKRTLVAMHRFILGLTPGSTACGDHVNRNTLDNRRENLRVATRAQNNTNTGIRMDNTTGFKGISKLARCARWQANIRVNGKAHYLGCFRTPEEAHAAYCEASVKLHGVFGWAVNSRLDRQNRMMNAEGKAVAHA